jgi:hypothetical protein
MHKYIPEVLAEINNDPKAIEKFKGDGALSLLFKHAFDPSQKFLLPEGDPPYKEDPAPIGMTPAILKQELKRLYVFCRADLTAVRREDLFIQLLESVHPTEAKVVLAVKDQTLDKLYPNVTHKLAYENGFVTVPPVETVKKSEPVSEEVVMEFPRRGRPKKAIGQN